jgi:hypothetical protein|nr:MAG TPA: dehydrogenase accessory protein [Caudoviricetes sp.]
MSSVTPRERHAVAKSLRYLADLPGEPLENDGQFIEVLKYWIFADFKRYSYDETLTRLADLIDPMYEPEPEWTAWFESLKNGDVVDRFAYDLIEHGGDMGPNGNTYNGVDEGLVLTEELFAKFETDFKAEIEANAYDEEPPFRYCPHCGARVVKE